MVTDSLYSRPLPSKRTGAIYNAFSYPTKIDAEVIGVFIAAHTRPGDVVLDGFGGSGSTGIAARLCDRPTQRMREMATAAGIDPCWGPRRAVIYELSPLGALLGRIMADPPDPEAFADAASKLVLRVEDELGWMYDAVGPSGESGQTRHVIWTEVLRVACCGHRITLWDASVALDPVTLSDTFVCPACGAENTVASCERATVEATDPITGELLTQRERRPARIYGESAGKTWSREPSADDLDLLGRVAKEEIGPDVPVARIAWGDLYRSGYHAGITHIHHLYTDRNLRVLSRLWTCANDFGPTMRDALRLLILSYNASHSTLMTRVVLKQNQRDFVITGAQSGVLYVSGLPVEKNVLKGLRRKIRTFADAFAMTYDSRSEVSVVNASSTQLDLADDSIDYVFTDPPFGDFIPYAEVNEVNEAWLGAVTDRRLEAIVSRAQKKGVDEYAGLMKEAFAEITRVLRPDGAATVIFHASKPAVWEAVGEAFRSNHLQVERTSVLNKTQVSFKQVVHDGGTRGDAVFLLRLAESREVVAAPMATGVALIDLLRGEAAGDDEELAPKRMYSRYVARCVEESTPVALSAPEFYALVEQNMDAMGRAG